MLHARILMDSMNDKLNDKDFEAFICKYVCVILLGTFILNIKNIKKFIYQQKTLQGEEGQWGGAIILTKPDMRKHIFFFKSNVTLFAG